MEEVLGRLWYSSREGGRLLRRLYMSVARNAEWARVIFDWRERVNDECFEVEFGCQRI